MIDKVLGFRVFGIMFVLLLMIGSFIIGDHCGVQRLNKERHEAEQELSREAVTACELFKELDMKEGAEARHYINLITTSASMAKEQDISIVANKLRSGNYTQEDVMYFPYILTLKCKEWGYDVGPDSEGIIH